MQTLTFANQKGGVGKTANAVHLAFYLTELGKSVLFIDLDTQANASFTLKDYEGKIKSSELFENSFNTLSFKEKLVLIPADNKLADIEKSDLSVIAQSFVKNLSSLSTQFDYCLIDTAPAFGARMTSALIGSDFVVSPVELEIYSMQGIAQMLRTIQQIKKFNSKLKFLGMLASKVDGRNPRHTQHLKELSTKYPDLLIPHTIGLRSSIADGIASGVPVWTIRKTAARVAAKELKAVCEYIVSAMEEN